MCVVDVDPVKILNGQVQWPVPSVPIVVDFLKHHVLDQGRVSKSRNDNLTTKIITVKIINAKIKKAKIGNVLKEIRNTEFRKKQKS